MFQVKHHRTVDGRVSVARNAVVEDFVNELKENVVAREGSERVNFFFLITNVPSSEHSQAKITEAQKRFNLAAINIHADVWWQEAVTSFLDRMPNLWAAFPELFAGRILPFVGEITGGSSGNLARSVRLALDRQYNRDSLVRFKQIQFERELVRVFVDLDISLQQMAVEDAQPLVAALRESQFRRLVEHAFYPEPHTLFTTYPHTPSLVSGLGVLLCEGMDIPTKLILEGGPGQGKSTLTQMVAQIHRNLLLKKPALETEGRWDAPLKCRLPVRVELRFFADWLSRNAQSSMEQYIASLLSTDSGGEQIGVADVHTLVERDPIFLLLDGLDEIGSDDLRDTVLDKILECIYSFEETLKADLRVILTTRPPAIAGRGEKLSAFSRLRLAPMEDYRINAYVTRWLSVHVVDLSDRTMIKGSFESRRMEPHVKALAKNPMQLSVLLDFIRLKGEAFPDNRAELYRDYFEIFINRDVEKSPGLRADRRLVVSLHEFLGYKIHTLMETGHSDGTLTRPQLLGMVGDWLRREGRDIGTAEDLFELGQERLGLIVTLKGEGQETRYGYEIQPIREYFVASFIHNRIAGDTHVVFQEMVRRPFWREVAIFLAGLGKPNEKADLVARARALDEDDDLGWRQDGRTITLQLLQEGVFGEPFYVYSDALSYVLESLDPQRVPVQAEPREVMELLPSVLNNSIPKRVAEALRKIVERYQESVDEHLHFRLTRAACRVFSDIELQHMAMAYRGNSHEMLAKMRLYWPLRYFPKANLNDMAAMSTFWAGVPMDVWARYLIAASRRDIQAVRIPAPPELHLYLLREIAMGASISAPKPLSEIEDSIHASRWAAWRLIRLLQHVSGLSLGRMGADEGSGNMKDAVISILRLSDDIDYSGLDEPVRQLTQRLLSLMCNVLLEYSQTAPVSGELYQTYLLSLTNLCEQPEWLGWLASRASLVILQYVLLRRVMPHPNQPANEDFLHLYNQIVKAFTQSPESIHEYALLMDAEDYYAADAPMISRIPVSQRRPRYFKLAGEEHFIDVVDVLAARITNGSTGVAWLGQYVLTTDLLRPLSEKCMGNLAALLSFVGKSELVRLRGSLPLLTPHVNKVLAYVRTATDPDCLLGALHLLSTSQILRSGGAELIAKMLRADQRGSWIAAALFGDTYDGRRDPAADATIYASIARLANIVVASPNEYPCRTVCAAATYLSDGSYKEFPLQPLSAHEVELGLLPQGGTA